MDTQQVSAPLCAPSPVSGGLTPSVGVIHVNVRHTTAFTVIGNHLSQHRALSLLAIGLAVHIQSLPAGARIGIKRLAERFPESEVRIAAALRELEATGYLRRSRERMPSGRIVTRTVSYNQPGATTPALAHARPAAGRRSTPSAPVPPGAPRTGRHRAPTQRAEPLPAPPSTPAPEGSGRRSGPTAPVESVPVLLADTLAPAAPMPAPPEPGQVEAPSIAPVPVPAPTARPVSSPPMPRPQTACAELNRAATAILADLRRLSPQLTLSEGDIGMLAPGVTAWLERDVHADTIRHALTADLPVPLKHPAKLLRHRITALLPPPLPGVRELAPVRPGTIVIPLQNCDRCDRAFRSRHPGHCRDCGSGTGTAA
ncbi:helix-turn-helix domain-containing protein [Streptomyces sp. NBC_01341]|uniref:helix-turn-helix domain-containing protein n=1 Tax=Streptomyces sp. NBC_01341 TaxID=2903831 RepID=UPI002E10F3CA|nr:helix-turn-helix domain-containing protein [Streptomyces sp. NBC_01341]